MTAAEQQELVEFLERDQLVIDTSRPVERMALTRRLSLALWTMRVFVVVVGLMVIYTFVSQLVH